MTDQSPSPRKALITGTAGQDGSYLAELPLSKGYGGLDPDRYMKPAGLEAGA